MCCYPEEPAAEASEAIFPLSSPISLSVWVLSACLWALERTEIIDKKTMFQLLKQIKPQITQEEFAARFRRIDEDKSGVAQGSEAFFMRFSGLGDRVR